MKKLVAVWLSVIVLFVAAGCGSDARSTVYHASDMKKIIAQIDSDTSLTEDEQNLFKNAIKNDKDGAYEGKTVGEIIDTVKAIKEQAQKEKQEMQDALTITVTNKTNLERNPDEWRYYPEVQFDIEIANKSDKPIRAFKGTFHIMNVFGDEIIAAGYIDSDRVQVGETQHKVVNIEVDQTSPEDMQLYNTALSELKITWETTALAYTDGVKIGEDKQYLHVDEFKK